MSESVGGWLGEWMNTNCEFYTKVSSQVETIIVHFLTLH